MIDIGRFLPPYFLTLGGVIFTNQRDIIGVELKKGAIL